jgi:hypothetical protein
LLNPWSITYPNQPLLPHGHVCHTALSQLWGLNDMTLCMLWNAWFGWKSLALHMPEGLIQSIICKSLSFDNRGLQDTHNLQSFITVTPFIIYQSQGTALYNTLTSMFCLCTSVCTLFILNGITGMTDAVHIKIFNLKTWLHQTTSYLYFKY